MGETITLTDEDRAVLAELADGPAEVDALAEESAYDRETLRDRLAGMADAGLARRTDEGWAATASGRRAVAAPGDGSADQRIDTPPEVEAAITGFDLRADREEAVRNAFGFLRFWGEAGASEIVDGVYEENPAGFESRGDWWAFVRGHLADLPGVAHDEEADEETAGEAATSDGVASKGATTSGGANATWRYEGATGRDEDDGADGRRMLGVDAPTGAKYALAGQGLSREEAAAAATALGVLQERGVASEREIADAVFDDHPAGYDDPEDWWRGFLRAALRGVPAVEREGDGWRYVGRDHDSEDESDDPRPDGGAEQVAEDDTASDADTQVEVGDPCPVCGDTVSGRVFIRSDETVLPDDGLATCVRADRSDEVDHPVLTLYYHRGR